MSSLAAAGAGDSDDDVDKTDTRQRALAAIRANDFSSLQPLLAQLPINELDAEQVNSDVISSYVMQSPACPFHI